MGNALSLLFAPAFGSVPLRAADPEPATEQGQINRKGPPMEKAIFPESRRVKTTNSHQGGTCLG